MVPTCGWEEAKALVAFVRAIGLRRGDVQRLSITGPDGATFVDHTEKPLDRDKAQVLLFSGKKRPPEGFRSGPYRADYLSRTRAKFCFSGPSRFRFRCKRLPDAIRGECR